MAKMTMHKELDMLREEVDNVEVRVIYEYTGVKLAVERLIIGRGDGLHETYPVIQACYRYQK